MKFGQARGGEWLLGFRREKTLFVRSFSNAFYLRPSYLFNKKGNIIYTLGGDLVEVST
jgi:hypothetical protein